MYANNTSFMFEAHSRVPLVNPEEVAFYLKTNPTSYFIVHLGTMSHEWNVDMFDEFTSVIDNTQKLGNVLGYTLKPEDLNVHANLPYLKAVIKDLKQYILFKAFRNVPIGLELSPSEGFSFLASPELNYLKCENKYPLDYLYKNGELYPSDQYNSGSDIQPCNATALSGINGNFLPYPPRPSRCDCIMSALTCIVNPHSAVDFETDITILNQICSQVYCGSLQNDPETGRFGIFASCSNTQKTSIAMNLYYTFHKNATEYCHWNGNAKRLFNTAPLEQYLKIIDFEGKQCREEIREDWSRYLIGVAKNHSITHHHREQVYNYDDMDLSNLPNNALANLAKPLYTLLCVMVNIIIHT